jgi:bifunctional non-homologous end joining protein LigD
MIALFAARRKLLGLVAHRAGDDYILSVYGPVFIPPCSPTTARNVPASDGWIHEPKLDGYRIQIVKDGRQVCLYSRRGYDWTKRLASVVEGPAGIACRSAVIDGELCFLTGIGAPDFAGLQLALGSRQYHKLTVFAFDLLYRDGADLRQLPLTERRRRLERLLASSDVRRLRLVEAFNDCEMLLNAAEGTHLEGIVSKRSAAPYRSGECRDWVNVKTEAWRKANRERWREFEGTR